MNVISNIFVVAPMFLQKAELMILCMPNMYFFTLVQVLALRFFCNLVTSSSHQNNLCAPSAIRAVEYIKKRFSIYKRYVSKHSL
jgi:hypothetical protein